MNEYVVCYYAGCVHSSKHITVVLCLFVGPSVHLFVLSFSNVNVIKGHILKVITIGQHGLDAAVVNFGPFV